MRTPDPIGSCARGINPQFEQDIKERKKPELPLFVG